MALEPQCDVLDPIGISSESAKISQPRHRQPRHERCGPNILILSAAGKPIFVRYGKKAETELGHDDDDADEDEWTIACGVLQGLRANVLSFGIDDLDGGSSASLGDICSIKAGRRLFVFKNTTALTFVAISYEKNGNHNESWLRLQLEYVYSQVIFTITEQVQTILTSSPSYDLRSILGPNVNDSIRNLLDGFHPIGNDLFCDDEIKESANGKNEKRLSGGSRPIGCASFMTSGIECINPIPPEIRDNASKLLIQACGYGQNQNNRILFAMLLIGTRLVTIVQPSDRSSQLHTSDIHLILTFVGRQPTLLINENLFPLCLPRFDSSGFLYAYTSCLDQEIKLSLAMISAQNDDAQFEAFRNGAHSVRVNLGLPLVKTGVIRVFDSSTNYSASSSVSTQILDNRIGILNERNSTSKGAEKINSEHDETEISIASWELESDNDSYSTDKDANEATGINMHCHRAPLLTALQVALSTQQQDEMMKTYLELGTVLHFVFRCDIFVNSGESHAACGDPSTGAMLTQCFGPPLTLLDTRSHNLVWDIYQRLSLRLRLGSASVESVMDAVDVIEHKMDSKYPMQILLELPPYVHSVTYHLESDKWLFIGLNGKFFELFATLPATIPPKTGTAYCARLVRKLMEDERFLFLSNPLTWGYFGERAALL